MNKKDAAALKLFRENYNKYDLDMGTLEHRYETAYQMTKDLFSDTPYYANVEEYCMGCTVTKLYKKDKENSHYGYGIPLF